MAMDVYLQVDGIKGESLDAKHKGWIEITGLHWGGRSAQERDRIDGRRPHGGTMRAPDPLTVEGGRPGFTDSDANLFHGQNDP
jgi:type VI protein secretion system component Hcp